MLHSSSLDEKLDSSSVDEKLDSSSLDEKKDFRIKISIQLYRSL